VTVVEVMDRILPVEDEEISALALKAFTKQGMKVMTGATVEKLARGSDRVTATVKTKDGKSQAIEVERVISAVGIVGNVENLGLEALGVKIDRSHIVVNEWGRDQREGACWRSANVAGPPWLAHKASHEGVIAVERIAGVKGLHPLDVTKIPGCTYCWPQVASVGA
jgi:dihydrolipoamide dehydrogenase